MTLLACACGTLRSATELSPDEYELQYVTGSYHASDDRHPGCVPYVRRYLHDLNVSKERLARYGQVLNGRLNRFCVALDVGCANGAFVDAAQAAGISRWGVDLVSPLNVNPKCLVGRAGELPGGLPDRFDMVTYHDVLEHVVDPLSELDSARAILSDGGVLILDVPDVSTPAGEHHFKPEHLWYFSEQALLGLLRSKGFESIAVDRPIPGKLVAYGEAR